MPLLRRGGDYEEIDVQGIDDLQNRWDGRVAGERIGEMGRDCGVGHGDEVCHEGLIGS
jgi:hypothetical protein